MSFIVSKYCFPKGPAVFAGRKKSLEYLKKGFFRYNVLVIDGIAGIGKTAFSLYFASLIEEEREFSDFHNKLIWIQCEEEWRLETLLYEINLSLKELGDHSFDAYLQDNSSDFYVILKALTSILNRENYVMFIDDYNRIKGSERYSFLKIFSRFLKKSRVIIISRQKPELLPVEWMEIFEFTLEYLNKQESFLMIKNLMEFHSMEPMEESTLEELYKSTGGHPFLIKSFLGLLFSGDYTARELLKKLDFSEPYIFSHIINDLRDTERDFLISFSVYRQPVKKDALFCIYSGSELEKILDILKRKFLIDLGLDKKYFVHSLIRDFCYSRSNKKTLHKACACYYMDLLTSQGYTLEIAKEAFYHYFKSEEYIIASRILQNMMGQMISYFQINELESNIDDIFKSTREVFPFLVLGKAEILRIKGRSREAIKLLEETMSELKDYERNQFLMLLARILSRLGKWDRAVELIKESIHISNKYKDKFSVARCYSFMGSIYRLKGDYSQALDYYEQARLINKDVGNEKLEVSLEQSIYITLAKKDGYSERILLLMKNCLNKTLERDWIDLKLSLVNNLAYAYYDMGYYDEALKFWMDNFDRAREYGWKEALMHSLTGTSLLFEERGEPMRAVSQYREALNISREIEDNYFQNLILLRLGSLFIQQGDIEEGQLFIEKASLISKEYNFLEFYVDSILHFAEINFIRCKRDCIKDFLCEVMDKGNDVQLAKAYRINYILEADVKFRELSQEKIINLHGSRKRRTEQYVTWFDTVAFKISPTSTLRKYLVKMHDRQYDATIDEIERLRKRREDFEIFIDGINGIISERIKGEIKIYKKKSLSELLFFFIRHGGEFFSPRELFPSVWKAKYVHNVDSPTVKMSISRLRKLIEPSPSNPKYLKLSPIRYKEERKYYFDDNCRFCFIEESFT